MMTDAMKLQALTPGEREMCAALGIDPVKRAEAKLEGMRLEARDLRLGETQLSMCRELGVDPSAFEAYRDGQRATAREALSAGRGLTSTERLCMDPAELRRRGEAGVSRGDLFGRIA